MTPGQVYRLVRKGAKNPVKSEIIRIQERVSQVDTLDLAAHVLALYKFPPPNPGEDLLKFEERSRRVARVRTDRAADLIAAKPRA